MEQSVFVVDDDHSILELLGMLLESEGYQVQVFDSGEAALEAAQAHQPSAAVIDLMMPGMDGLELIQALRRDPHTHDIPILVCSAYYGDLRRSIVQLGPENVAYLRKPFQIQDMLKTVARLVSGGENPPPSAVDAPALQSAATGLGCG